MEAARKRKVGLFGGTFNPPHIGHLRAAEEVREALDLEGVIFIPSRLSPHKSPTEVPRPQDRLKMVELATGDNPHFSVSDVELKREGPSYTVDTLRGYVSKCPEDDFYFILGSDLFQEIDAWKDWEELFELAHFVVLARPGYSEKNLFELPLALKRNFRYDKSRRGGEIYKGNSSKTLTILRITGIELSSTRVRELRKRGLSIKYLVTDGVHQFIDTNKLYRGGS